MTLIEFQNKWNLSNCELACIFSKSEQTIKQYKARPGTKSHRKTPGVIIRLCIELDEKWAKKGVQLIAV